MKPYDKIKEIEEKKAEEEKPSEELYKKVEKERRIDIEEAKEILKCLRRARRFFIKIQEIYFYSDEDVELVNEIIRDLKDFLTSELAEEEEETESEEKPEETEELEEDIFI